LYGGEGIIPHLSPAHIDFVYSHFRGYRSSNKKDFRSIKNT
jgi:hypothetical protein